MRALRAILKTVWLYSLALWIYAAAVALADPDRVSERFLLMKQLPRTDTSGAIAFGVSALSLLVLRSLRRVNGPDQRLAGRVIDAALGTTALYAFLGWVYVAANVIQNPGTLPLQLTHLTTRPTESQFGAICFVLSALSACVFWARQPPARSKHAATSGRWRRDSALGVDHDVRSQRAGVGLANQSFVGGDEEKEGEDRPVVGR
jgi:hypothetical protein